MAPALFTVVHLLALTLFPTISAYDWIPDPAVGGGSDNGWNELPEVPGANLITNFPIPGTSSVLPVYQSSGLNTSEVTRAIIAPGAKDRDHWSYWITQQNIKLDLASTDPSFNPNTTSILTPCFLIENDVNAGAGTPGSTLFWSASGWFGGEYSKGPSANDKISSFDVLDSLVNYYTNASMYPNMQAIVFAGHSAAGQLFQRYAAMRQPTQNDDLVNYIVANAGSYMWLTPDRPAPNASCPNVDDYKYGLAGNMVGYSTGDFNRIGRDGIVSRYSGRNVHYALGTADNGPGDTACQAVVQGATHLERGNNFISMLKGMPNGMPSAHTIDMIEGVSHQQAEMFNSTQLRQRLFKEVTATGPLQDSAATSTTTNPSSTATPVSTPTGQRNANSNAARISFTASYILSVIAILAVGGILL